MKTNIDLTIARVSVLLLICLFFSCKSQEEFIPETPKEITGVWRISKAVRNGADITEKFNFNDFRVDFKSDGTYQLSQPIPFIVSTNGTYTLDDPQYPFEIKFDETSTGYSVSSLFEYPIVQGKRQLSLTFHTGCNTNSYTYTLIAD
ncbi:DUF5004 domain-containing protein [Sphingobacterium griseoflavum]|uniref:DUF5004 domain-containing protein n=1 Tax=Sphingobacterium griseoflavum TaxID=1474952 RepID=A0ABQ3HUS2_9SPHI|nr:DUF5004 domain-containing protein [Sphingobacterium griseoflavum]GHE35715.1 DUF5004 domain-containing protein [Sphingobacterium griseoflavum]